MVNQHPVRISGHRYCGIKDILLEILYIYIYIYTYICINIYTFLLTLQIYNNNKIKGNNTEDTTKTSACFPIFEKQGILNTG